MDPSRDVALLQTAAALENLLVATYSAALGLAVVQTGPAQLLTLAMTALDHHADHAMAFNAAASAAGGSAQTEPDPTYLAIARAAQPGLRTVVDVVHLVTRLEQVAAQTYVRDAGAAAGPALRALLVSVAAVEAQHAAALLVSGDLLAADLSGEVRLGPDLDGLPTSAGAVGFPAAFFPTAEAVPAGDGAVG